MRYDELVRDRLLLQLEQCDEIVTKRKDEAHHIALLIDEGYVDGRIIVEDDVLKGASAWRLKRKGYEKLSQIKAVSQIAPVGTGTAETDGSECYYSGLRARCNELIQKSNAAHDALIKVLATGGIGLFFTFLGLVGKGDLGAPTLTQDQLRFGFIPVFLWTLALVLLLVSHFVSVGASRKIIRSIDDRKDVRKESEKNRKWVVWLNLVNAALTIFGILLFSIFVYGVFQ